MNRMIVVWYLLFFLSGCAFQQPDPTPVPCSDALGCVTIAPGEPVKLGVLQTLSGGSLPAGTEQLRSIQLAVSDAGNALMDHPIQLMVEDERCSQEGGANAALRIVADPTVIAILGTNCSGAAITASRIMSEAGLVMISSANTAPSLTSIAGKQGDDWHPGYYRISWNDSTMGRVAATFAHQKLQLTRAATIHAGDAYTRGLTDVFTGVFEELGGKVVLVATIDEVEEDLLPTVEAVALSEAQLVFFPLSHPDTGARLLTQARTRLQDVAFIGGEALLSDVFLKKIGADGVGLYLLGPAAPDRPGNSALRQKYRQQYNEDPPSIYYSFAYDAASLLLNAIEKTAQSQPDGSLVIGRQALRDTLSATRGYEGLSGSLTCDAFGDCSAARLNVMQVTTDQQQVEQLRHTVVF